LKRNKYIDKEKFGEFKRMDKKSFGDGDDFDLAEYDDVPPLI